VGGEGDKIFGSAESDEGDEGACWIGGSSGGATAFDFS
jgi:hypothetical protein